MAVGGASRPLAAASRSLPAPAAGLLHQVLCAVVRSLQGAPLAARSLPRSRIPPSPRLSPDHLRPRPRTCLQRLAPTWEELAKSFVDNPKVSIASVDCTEHKDTCTAAEVRACVRCVWCGGTEAPGGVRRCGARAEAASLRHCSVTASNVCYIEAALSSHSLSAQCSAAPHTDPGLPHAQGVPRWRGAGRGVQG